MLAQGNNLRLRRRWKPGQEQNTGPENQDSQHMLEQPRGYFPDFKRLPGRSQKTKSRQEGGAEQHPGWPTALQKGSVERGHINNKMTKQLQVLRLLSRLSNTFVGGCCMGLV